MNLGEIKMKKIAADKNYRMLKSAEVNKEELSTLVNTFLMDLERCVANVSPDQDPRNMHPASVPSYRECADPIQKAFCKEYISTLLDAGKGNFVTNALGISSNERLDMLLYLTNRFKSFFAEKGLSEKIVEYMLKSLSSDLEQAHHQERNRRIREDYKPSL
jgi:hypothetical protein